MKKILLLLLAMSSSLMASIEKTFDVEADIADYSNSQVVFSGNVRIDHPAGTITANKATIVLENVDGQTRPYKMLANGDVLIHKKQEDEKERYIIADAAEYAFHSHEILLSGDKAGQVLYFDTIHGMQMSASQIVVKRGVDEMPESVHGYGAVRFIFDEREAERFNKTFHLKG
jgi:lipopolysaccharide export system protein LptA